ncbi:hypothetical protein ABIB85_005442 [Bradyrhizobium sp. JR1.5]|uniref:Eco57I restriction-modification methylase domain-containing protein n=1 Tax=unclassified Bradyrhizobium TaxID=2631580 RepID=UPI003392B8CA
MAIALERSVRSILRTAIIGQAGARRVAEDGARKALTEIGLEEAKRPDGLSPAQAELRNRLRAHARSLGDVMQPDGSIKATRLVREIAYEHWHRALFARFLAENDLLIDPEHKVPVSLGELELVAKEEGRDLTELAADWAEPMLPQIFRKDDPVLALSLPPETKGGLAEIVNGLPRAVFGSDDSLGWVYQFWQVDRKAEVDLAEKRGSKIGADEISPVTQLFTDDYMVLFLLENTLGAWWASKVLAADPVLAIEADSEDELRDKTSPDGYRWRYLRFVRELQEGETEETATGPWRPAAGNFVEWPIAAKGITVLDPCMGSGHFLVFALSILVAFRRAEEGLDEREAVKAVVADNLFGLEIDLRCTQIAAFALALACWKRLGGPEPLPRLNLACSGLAIGLGKPEFLKLAEKIASKRGWKPPTDLLGDGALPMESAAIKREREGLARLYDLFEKAPFLGSLIDPRQASSDLFASGYEDIEGFLDDLLKAGEGVPEVRELAVVAAGLAQATQILRGTYTLVSTNVPYLGRAKMSATIGEFVDQNYRLSRSDLATCFIERLLRFCAKGGVTATVTPQNWWFLGSYKALRLHLLERDKIILLVDLGPAAFEVMNWWAAKTNLQIIGDRSSSSTSCLDASAGKWPIQKERNCRQASVLQRSVRNFLDQPDHRFAFAPPGEHPPLSTQASCLAGILNGDTPRFIRKFWEFAANNEFWTFQQTTVDASALCGGLDQVIYYDGRNGHLREDAKIRRERLHDSDQRGGSVWGRPGIAISQMRALPVARYFGDKFDSNVAALVPTDPTLVPALWCFCTSEEFIEAIRNIEKKLNVTNATFAKISFEQDRWRKVANEKFPRGLPKPYSNDPTQWLFDGHPRGSADPNVAENKAIDPGLIVPLGVRPGLAEHPLQVAVARLLGYRWPRQTGSSFMDCPPVTEPDEVDRSGLIDSDGVVSLPALAGETDAAARLRELIRAAWGSDYNEGTIRELLGAEGARANDLTTWLADEFFEGHCELFHQIPFIWHVWDGVRGGFSALVNYHKLSEGNGAGRRLLEKLRDSYLGEWIALQRRALASGEVGAEERLMAAEHLRGELTGIIEGVPPYDTFVRWKPLHRQAIGWEPDIDDGIRINIRPFLNARPKKNRGQGACILRVTPRVKKHAGADRGSEPRREKMEFPWFWAEDADVSKVDFAGVEFKGRRYNDFHYSRGFKQRARDKQSKKS